MPASPISSEILEALARGAILLTSTQRPARALRQAYDAHQRAAGLTLWRSLEIFAFETWLASLQQNLVASGLRTSLLLNRAQQHHLWRNIIGADGKPRCAATSLATLALDAYATLCMHNGRNLLNDAVGVPDSRAFLKWTREFERTCTRGDYLTPAQLPATLEVALAEGHLPIPPAGLVLVDFDTPRPAHQSLLHAVESAGYPVARVNTLLPTPAASLHPAPDAATELRTAALWARDHLRAHPEARVAIVSAALAERRPTIERALTGLLPAASFEFSLGLPLDRTAAVSTAVDLLRWTTTPLPAERVRNLLLSPFFASPTPAESRAAATFDAQHLQTPEGLRPQHTLAFVLARAVERNSSALAYRLKALQSAATEAFPPTAPRQTYAHWTHVFRTILQATGWTAATESSSEAFQLRRRWESLLDEVATLDFEGNLVTAAIALEALAETARTAIFAPESTNAPIQVLGPLELGGTPFDALWFLSADDATWPPTTSLSPLIARSLQAQLKIPGANPPADTLTASALTRRIAASATTVVISYATRTAEGIGRPSPLLRTLNLPILNLEIAAPSFTPYETHFDTLPLPPLPPGTLRGGATILELQAACPFRAFAELRLFAVEPETPEPGLDTRERGGLAHRVMQIFWETLRTQAALKALTQTERIAHLNESIRQALTEHASRQLTPFDAEYLSIQHQRLASVLTPWLDLELNRRPFEVLAMEQELETKVGPLHLKLRVDRIDNTPAGTLILDYKTGAAAAKQWESGRPEKPQLPLYAIATNPPPAGIAFATLRAGKELKLIPIATGGVITASASKAETSFEDHLEEWRTVLTTLATNFAAGDVRVDPRAYPATCKHCGQRTLCRLNPFDVDDLSDEDIPIIESAPA